MAGGTRSYEMARRMVAAGHEVHMVTSYREQDDSRQGWFQTNEAGIQVHWYPVPYSNHMGFIQRLKAFFSFAFAARKKALQLDADIIFATRSEERRVGKECRFGLAAFDSKIRVYKIEICCYVGLE